jgi:hypothetical protein
MEPQSALTNVTSYLPSPADILLVFPRLLSKAGALGENVFGNLRSGGSIIAEPTANVTNATVASSTSSFVQASAATAASRNNDITMFQALKNVGSFFGYVTSKWGIATFTLVSSKLLYLSNLTDRKSEHPSESHPILRLQPSAALT